MKAAPVDEFLSSVPALPSALVTHYLFHVLSFLLFASPFGYNLQEDKGFCCCVHCCIPCLGE